MQKKAERLGRELVKATLGLVKPLYGMGFAFLFTTEIMRAHRKNHNFTQTHSVSSVNSVVKLFQKKAQAYPSLPFLAC